MGSSDVQNLPSKSVASFDKLVARVLSGEQTDYEAYTSLLKEGRTLSFLLPSLSTPPTPPPISHNLRCPRHDTTRHDTTRHDTHTTRTRIRTC
jgi:hypothetical protein